MFIIKQNDTLPNLEAQLLDHEDKPINLELCGVAFHMLDREGQLKINRPVEIVNVVTGETMVNWVDGDTDVAGIYKCEFEVNMPDGKILTVPNDGYFLINIVSELA